jgi:glycosyltransferase involved in cell wall biosynthesis
LFIRKQGSSDVLPKLVTVIIPSRNSDRKIEKCLLSIKNQTYKNIEILVIDAFSTDNTHKIISRFGTKVFSLEGERAKAKNFGISKSIGEFLLFIDSDMILEHRVVEECVKVCSNKKGIVGVIIPERSVGSGFWIKVRDFERRLYVGSDIESARFFIKKFVTQVGGFDEDIIGYEEATLPQKLRENELNVNARISSFILHDEEGFNLVKWLDKKRYYSVSSRLYSQKYEKYARKQLAVMSRLNIFLAKGNWKILIRHPILSIGMIILKTLEYFSSNRHVFTAGK